MLEEEKKSNSAVAIPLVVLILAGIYVFADGWFFNVIEPHTAVAVYEPRGIRALYNGEDKPKRMWKWPRIPGTLIGVKEEPVKDEVKVAEDSFAFYTSYELTGKEEDREYVQAYKVRVKMKVKDWQKFFREINLDEINKQRRKAGPFTPLIKDRFELIASQVKEVLRGGPVQDNFGNPLRDEKGYPVMNLNGWVNFISSELLGRRNFLIALFDHHDFKTPESVKKYLKEEAPWYWFAGPDLFELMAQRFKDIQEAVKSPYSENLSEKASLKRFVFGEERFELYRQAYRAYQYENFLMATKQALEEINLRLSQTQDEKARQLLLWQKEKLDFEKKRWEKVKEEELIPFFKFYSSSESRLACDIRKVTPQENELLWEVAIKEVFEGEDLSKLSLFILHKTKSKDTLEKIKDKYRVDWKDIFNDYNQEIIEESLDEERRQKLEEIIKEGLEKGNLKNAYEFVKDVPLKEGKILVIPRVKKFTPEWFQEEKELVEKREAIIKRYLYTWIEKIIPSLAEKYVNASPWIDYLEKIYGVKIEKVTVGIEKDRLFTKAGEPKDKYYELYYSKYVLEKREGR